MVKHIKSSFDTLTVDQMDFSSVCRHPQQTSIVSVSGITKDNEAERWQGSTHLLRHRHDRLRRVGRRPTFQLERSVQAQAAEHHQQQQHQDGREQEFRQICEI